MPISSPPESLFLQSLLNASNDAIITTDCEGLITSFNQRAEVYLGYSADEVMGQHSLLHWHDPDQIKNLIPARHDEGDQIAFADFLAHTHPTASAGDPIWTIRRKDQSRFPARLALTPMKDDAAVVIGYLAQYEDATLQQNTLKNLRGEERRFQDVMDYSAMGMATVSLEGAWVTLNQVFCDMLGYTREELFTMSVQQITYNEDLADDLARAQQLIDGKLTHYHLEKRYIHKDGSIVWVLLSVSLVRDENGDPLYFVAQMQNITERKLATEELAASAELLRGFITHAPVAIAMLDKEMRYLNVSERWITEYNLPTEEVIGRSHYELFPHLPQRWKDVHQRVLQGTPESSREDEYVLEDGSIEWLNWEARPWHNAQGEIGGLIFFTRIITKEKQSQEELERLVRELERSNRELEQFAYVASHDMQEPLRAVASCADILKSRYHDKLDAKANELIMHVVEGANRMQRLIQDLLQLSRINTRPDKPVTVDLNQICQSVLQDLSSEIRKSVAKIEIGPLPILRGDPTQLKQVFQNLVSNALKYRGKTNPIIQIEATEDADGYQFAVSDNGIGIEETYFNKIFGIFQRLHTRQEYPGTGMGLALCKKIIERHRGRIWLTSTPGSGSVFYFTLPNSSSGYLHETATG